MSFTPGTYRCNICGIERREANHWYAIRNFGSRQTIFRSIGVLAFDDANSDDEHYCGEQHLLKGVDLFINELRQAQQNLAEMNAADVVVVAPVLDAEFREVDESETEAQRIERQRREIYDAFGIGLSERGKS